MRRLRRRRPAGLGYEADNVRQDYTGYERDAESGLEFAQARYYNAGHGRFTSADPLTASASIRDPQTFNRYSYALNSPYKFTDPLGLISSSTGACGQFCKGGLDGGGTFAPKSRDEDAPEPLPAPEAHTNEAAEPAEATLNHEPGQLQQQGQAPTVPATQNDPALAAMRAQFPEFNQADAATVNSAIADVQNSVDFAYSTLLTVQFRRLGDGTSPTPQAAVRELSLGSIRVLETDPATGLSTSRELSGTVFDGRTSTLLIDHDDNGSTAAISVAQFFTNEGSVTALTTSGGQIFLGPGFFDGGRESRAKDLIHEGVVHRGLGRRDVEFDSGGDRSRGSRAINSRINLYFQLRRPEVIVLR